MYVIMRRANIIRAWAALGHHNIDLNGLGLEPMGLGRAGLGIAEPMANTGLEDYILFQENTYSPSIPFPIEPEIPGTQSTRLRPQFHTESPIGKPKIQGKPMA